MALVIHQVQGSYAPSRSFWNRGVELTRSSSTISMVQRMNINLFQKKSCLCGESPLIHGSNRRFSKIASFKGSVQSDVYKNRARRSKSRKNPVKLLHVSCDNRIASMVSPKVQDIHVNSTSDTDVTTEGIHRLLKSWLTVLPQASRTRDETLDGSSLNKRVETNHNLLQHGILKTIWTTIKISAIILIPLFLIVNMKYGSQVAKELSPLWIGGPLLIALYIKMVQSLCSLYVYAFKQSVKVLTVSHGKDKEFILVHLWQRAVYFMNLDYNYELKRMWKHFRVWFVDACLDFVESIWSYRKMVGVLKMAKIM